MSVETLRRLFKNVFGKSPEKYIHDLRISIATLMLENSSEPIEEISRKCGYQTVSCFNRQFKKIMKLSPGEWRSKYAGEKT